MYQNIRYVEIHNKTCVCKKVKTTYKLERESKTFEKLLHLHPKKKQKSNTIMCVVYVVKTVACTCCSAKQPLTCCVRTKTPLAATAWVVQFATISTLLPSY